jgi:hypothetical protein
MQTEKFCPRCKITKPVAEFNHRSETARKRFGLCQPYCRPCLYDYKLERCVLDPNKRAQALEKTRRWKARKYAEDPGYKAHEAARKKARYERLKVDPEAQEALRVRRERRAKMRKALAKKSPKLVKTKAEVIALMVAGRVRAHRRAKKKK